MEINVTNLVEAFRDAEWVDDVDVTDKEIHLYTDLPGAPDHVWEYTQQYCHYRLYTSDVRHNDNYGYIKVYPTSPSIDGLRYDAPEAVTVTVTGEETTVETRDVDP